MDLREQLGERLAEFDEVLEALRSAEGRMGELVAELRGAGVQREVLARRMEERLGLKRDTARRRLMVLEERLGVSGGPK